MEGISWVHQGVLSTSGDIMIPVGISWVHREMFNTSEGISWVHQGDIEIHVGIPWVHQGMFSTLGVPWVLQYIGVFNRNWKVFTNLLPHMHHDILNVLIVSPQCTHGIPLMYSWYPSHASWYPPDLLMISPDLLMISPDVLMIPPPPHVLKTHLQGANYK